MQGHILAGLEGGQQAFGGHHAEGLGAGRLLDDAAHPQVEAGRVQARQIGGRNAPLAAKVFSQRFGGFNELQHLLIAFELFGDVALHRAVLS